MVRYAIDTHVHTPASDGRSKYSKIINAACLKGLNAIAVTDHYNMDGVVPMQNLAHNYGLEIVPGIELNAGTGKLHIVGLDIQEPIPNLMGLERTLYEIDLQGGLPIIAHPFNGRQVFLSEVKPLLDSYLIGIECVGVNGGTRQICKFSDAFAFAEHYRLPKIGCSDSHSAKTVGLAASVCEGDSFKDFRRAFKERKIDIETNKYR
jgi:predicted metal-dependent phosphoesterase TrpH